MHRGGRTAPHRVTGRDDAHLGDRSEPATMTTAGSNTAAGDTAAKDAGPDLEPRPTR